MGVFACVHRHVHAISGGREPSQAPGTLRSDLVLSVAGDDADALSAELDRLDTQGLAWHVFVGAYGLVCAPHPRDYVWWHNSSTVGATWLEDMGVEVRRLGLLASWDVVCPEDPS